VNFRNEYLFVTATLLIWNRRSVFRKVVGLRSVRSYRS